MIRFSTDAAPLHSPGAVEQTDPLTNRPAVSDFNSFPASLRQRKNVSSVKPQGQHSKPPMARGVLAVMTMGSE